ncbi:MAG: EMC3/TMCO1 family protein [Euryarchaeota archaeon]|nr:EMC3/TMCO1 family protein [Euryarchaeota archaeon]
MPQWKETLERIALSLGISMLLGVVMMELMGQGEEFRGALATFVGALLGPLPTMLPIHITLFVMAAITGLYASLIQKYTINWEQMRTFSEKMKGFQKEYREAQLAENKQKLKKLDEKRAAMMGDQGKMMKQQLKPMAYISIISLPLFFWAYAYVDANPDFTIVFPFWGMKSLSEPAIYSIQYWIVWYMICSLPVSQVIRKALDIGGA